jgi:hypothetical protein
MKVFLSSTIEDMKIEREAITEVIISLQHKISRSEFFPSMARTPEDVCLEEAANSDIFIGVYKNRYGFIPPDHDNLLQYSVTQMEYETAKNNGVPCLIFIYKNEEEREERLSIFLDRIKDFSSGNLVQYYENVDGLKYEVLRSLVFHLKTVITAKEFEKLRTLLKKDEQDPYRGTLSWSMIDYKECEKLECFSGIRIGKKSILLKSPYVGEICFYEYDDSKPKTAENRKILSEAEFFNIINSIFSENDIYWITKDIWRVSS